MGKMSEISLMEKYNEYDLKKYAQYVKNENKKQGKLYCILGNLPIGWYTQEELSKEANKMIRHYYNNDDTENFGQYAWDLYEIKNNWKNLLEKHNKIYKIKNKDCWSICLLAFCWECDYE